MPFQPARQMIDAGCAIALASDYNPGSSPSGNMNLVVAMSCIGMKMLPEEAINAATLNGAFRDGIRE
jgi:imidazolonepropionase